MSDSVKIDDCFVDGKEERAPSVFLQWKGTDVCMDFYCECGAHCHFDGYGAYFVKCPHCSTIWQMPCHMFPRKAAADTHPDDILHAKTLEADEDHCDEDGAALPVAQDGAGDR